MYFVSTIYINFICIYIYTRQTTQYLAIRVLQYNRTFDRAKAELDGIKLVSEIEMIVAAGFRSYQERKQKKLSLGTIDSVAFFLMGCVLFFGFSNNCQSKINSSGIHSTHIQVVWFRKLDDCLKCSRLLANRSVNQPLEMCEFDWLIWFSFAFRFFFPSCFIRICQILLRIVSKLMYKRAIENWCNFPWGKLCVRHCSHKEKDEKQQQLLNYMIMCYKLCTIWLALYCSKDLLCLEKTEKQLRQRCAHEIFNLRLRYLI